MNIFRVLDLTNENIKLMNKNLIDLNDAVIAINEAVPHYIKACEERKKATDILNGGII
jgi:hypothetical protein